MGLRVTTWQRRLAKYTWSKANPDKVRQANRIWRQVHRLRYNQAAAARMRRYRARLRVTRLPSPEQL